MVDSLEPSIPISLSSDELLLVMVLHHHSNRKVATGAAYSLRGTVAETICLLKRAEKGLHGSTWPQEGLMTTVNTGLMLWGLCVVSTCDQKRTE